MQIYQLISRITFQLQKIHLYPVVLGTPKLAQQGALLGQEGQICPRLQKTDRRPALGSCSRTRRGPLKCTVRNPRAHSTNQPLSYPHRRMETPPPDQPGLLLVSFSHVPMLKLLSNYRSFTQHPPPPSGTCQHYPILSNCERNGMHSFQSQWDFIILKLALV